MLILDIPAYGDFKTVVKAAGTPKLVLWWSNGNPSLDTAFIKIWAIMDNQKLAFTGQVTNNPVGAMSDAIAALATDFPGAIQLTANAGIGGFSLD